MANTITGSPNGEHLFGTSGNDEIFGLGGDDTLESDFDRTGQDGDDVLHGGDGNDTLLGGAGFDTLDGGPGNDTLNANASGRYTFFPGIPGTDHHDPSPSDIVDGGDGIDTLVLAYANQNLLDSQGNPLRPLAVQVDISTGAGTVFPDSDDPSAGAHDAWGEAFTSIEILDFRGPDGDDIVTGGALNDQIAGNGGSDILNGGGGDDVISDTSGRIDADGGAGNDTFQLSRDDTADDVIDGNAGTLTVGGAASGTFRNFENLTASGSSGKNAIIGITTGRNVLGGGNDDDTITGGNLADILNGNGGTNHLSGGGGDDTITGTGNDTVDGGAGSDTITVGGQGGTDQVTAGANNDTVTVNLPAALAGSTFDGGDGTDTLAISPSIPSGQTGGVLQSIDLTALDVQNLENLVLTTVILNDPYVFTMTAALLTKFASVKLSNPAPVTIALSSNAPLTVSSDIENITIQLANGGQVADFSHATGFIREIIGGSGNDTITINGLMAGGAGDDALTGGSTFGGTVDYQFARSQYDLRTALGGDGKLHMTISQIGGTHVDGTDTLTNIQSLQFTSEQTHIQSIFKLAGADLNHVSNVDGGRFDDVLFQSQASGQVLFAKMVDGAFDSWGVETGALGGAGAIRAVASGDVNPGATGGAEVFVQQHANGAILFSSLDTGTPAWGVVSQNINADFKLIAAADINGDASVDALVQQQSNGSIIYADMHGGVFSGWAVVNASLTPDYKAIGAADINGDGFADVVVQQQSTGTIIYANMAHGAFAGWNLVTSKLNPDWHAMAAGDVNGDGFADVIVQNVTDGTTVFANMHNGAFVNWGAVAQHTGPDWIAAAIADVDNDGYRDVVFQHTTDGQTIYAHMGSAGFTGWGAIASNINADLHVV